MVRLRFILVVLLLAVVVRAADPEPTLGQKIVAFCQDHKDQEVGDGECSSLASHALHAAGAKGRGKDSPEKGDYVWGELALVVQSDTDKPRFDEGKAADIRPGDIIQFRDAKFEHHEGKRHSFQTFGHHTAVVSAVEGDVVHVYQQNFAGKKTVTSDKLRLEELKAGWLRFYHPIPKTGSD